MSESISSAAVVSEKHLHEIDNTVAKILFDSCKERENMEFQNGGIRQPLGLNSEPFRTRRLEAPQLHPSVWRPWNGCDTSRTVVGQLLPASRPSARHVSCDREKRSRSTGCGLQDKHASISADLKVGMEWVWLMTVCPASEEKMTPGKWLWLW